MNKMDTNFSIGLIQPAQFNGILLRNLPSSVNENISNQGREGAGGTWSESESEPEPEPEPESVLSY